jgi:hypothetical protein
MPDQPTEIIGKAKLALAAGAAILVAGLVLVAFILPAEFAVDPLGIGAKVGLLDLGVTGEQVEALEQAAATGSRAGQAAIIAAQERPFNTETVEFNLGPAGSIEYKYRLEQGESLHYSWSATGPVNVEFHAEPDGGPAGYAQTYEKSQGTAKSGTLTAPFPGIHGWYWQNTGSEPVTVTLTSAGFYNLAHEFRPDGSVRNKTFQ